MTESHQIYQGILQPRGFPGLPAGWESEWDTFPSADGTLQLFGVLHHAADWKRGRVLMVLHGIGEHGGRYLHFPHYLKDQVDAVYCMDHRGHGRSEGIRGHVDRFDLFAEDVAHATRLLEEKVRKRCGKAEIHLFAHSMGGLIALRTLFTQNGLPFRSVSLSAPLLAIKVKIPPVKKTVALAISKIWGSLQMKSEVNPADLSHDREVAEAYKADRLVHAKVTPRLFTEMLAAMDDTLKRDSGISQPLQMLVPLQDRIVDSDTTLEFFRALKLRDKQLRTYPEFFHEIVNEIGKEQVFQEIGKWITAHSQA